jgi:acyl-CoA thioesterase-2
MMVAVPPDPVSGEQPDPAENAEAQSAEETDELLELLDLEQLDATLFQGRQPRTESQRVFGGQVAAQALVAAGRTVPSDRPVHSLHAFFLRKGDPEHPIGYDVELLHDGGSFSTRRAVARQHGRTIFALSASFQRDQPGLEHQHPMPDAPDPESLPSPSERRGTEPPRIRGRSEWGAIDLRMRSTPIGTGITDDPTRPPYSQFWFRYTRPLPDDPLLHVCLLAYVSDLSLLPTALIEHDVDMWDDAVLMWSLDHAMWFHRPFRADEWILYDVVSPSASGSRGLTTGRFYTRDGRRVASVVQEGLIRVT